MTCWVSLLRYWWSVAGLRDSMIAVTNSAKPKKKSVH